MDRHTILAILLGCLAAIAIATSLRADWDLPLPLPDTAAGDLMRQLDWEDEQDRQDQANEDLEDRIEDLEEQLEELRR